MHYNNYSLGCLLIVVWHHAVVPHYTNWTVYIPPKSHLGMCISCGGVACCHCTIADRMTYLLTYSGKTHLQCKCCSGRVLFLCLWWQYPSMGSVGYSSSVSQIHSHCWQYSHKVTFFQRNTGQIYGCRRALGQGQLVWLPVALFCSLWLLQHVIILYQVQYSKLAHLGGSHHKVNPFACEVGNFQAKAGSIPSQGHCRIRTRSWKKALAITSTVP